MEKQTVALLEECNSGCKMAINSMDRLKDFVMDAKMGQFLEESKNEHKKLEEEAAELLVKSGGEIKGPDKMATAFSWVTTEMKLLIKDDNSQVAKILTEGCNMGIQSISECINKCPEASHESISLAKKLVKCEEKLREELKGFL